MFYSYIVNNTWRYNCNVHTLMERLKDLKYLSLFDVNNSNYVYLLVSKCNSILTTEKEKQTQTYAIFAFCFSRHTT